MSRTSGEGLTEEGMAVPRWLVPLGLLGALVLVLIMRGAGPDRPAVAPAVTLEAIQTDLEQPLWAGVAPGEPNKLYIAEKGGKVYSVVNGQRTLLVDLGPYLTASGTEQGLLGLAFHPDWTKNGLLFVHYSGKESGETVIARLQRENGRFDPAKQAIVFRLDQPYANHNGGSIEFGPDGYLYIALGDGGSAGDPQNRAQNREDLHGKILRLEVGAFEGYRIPASNPFINRPGRDEIWAYGLRNPWRVAFDRSTGDLWIGDVGQNRIEEIDRIPAGQGGLNFGWRILEGNERFSPGRTEGLAPPVATYTHKEGGCAVTGGVVYRGRAIPALVGSYLFGDYCSGKLWRLAPGSGQPELLLDTEMKIASFGLDEQGEVLVIDLKGSVNRLRLK
ncbi:MAG TPA: PQQ-dependent sugar dehydrogenase [Symbiobacteriaceae bacterium]|nr:PQQ-dependent sugar dehydrogenase [Symbiobacteriaceae bacterium]